MLWGLGVGYVISGEYFGWNLGLVAGGSFGMLFAFLLVTLMYVTFVFSYAEMACAIPRAGGVFVYGVRGLGMAAGYLGGIAQIVEFVFAPPAIAMFEMGRVGFLPHSIGRSNRKTQTPIHALLLNLAIGIVAILALDTTGLITMSAFGAVTLYIVSMIALIQLRRREPTLERPYRTPWYPVFPLVALSIAAVSLATMTYFNWNAGQLATSYSLWYYGFVMAAFVYYWAVVRKRLTAEDIAHFTRID